MHFLFKLSLAPLIKEYKILIVLPFSLKGKVKSNICASISKLQIIFFSLNPKLNNNPQELLSRLYSRKVELNI